jgi:hypothetical protein
MVLHLKEGTGAEGDDSFIEYGFVKVVAIPWAPGWYGYNRFIRFAIVSCVVSME